MSTSPEVAGPGTPAGSPGVAEPGAPAGNPGVAEPGAPAAPGVVPAVWADSAPKRVSHVPTCANCGAPVPDKFCGNCGQKLHSPVHSVWHFLGEATEDLTHADSRLWRTLSALLLKPGFLTREFLDGRRASYLPPVRLYLLLSVVFFLLAAAGGTQVELLGLNQQDNGTTRVVVSSVSPAAQPGESPEQREARVCGPIEYHGWWSARIDPAMRKVCVQALADNGRSAQEAFFHELPRAMFVFLPLLAALMKLLYWRPPHYYVEHLLLLVHNHAFTFFVAILSMLLRKVLPASIADSGYVLLLRIALQIYVALYIYWSMRRVYGQGRLLTTAKFVAMSCAYMFCGGLMVLLTFVYSTLAQ